MRHGHLHLWFSLGFSVAGGVGRGFDVVSLDEVHQEASVGGEVAIGLGWISVLEDNLCGPGGSCGVGQCSRGAC